MEIEIWRERDLSQSLGAEECESDVEREEKRPYDRTSQVLLCTLSGVLYSKMSFGFCFFLGYDPVRKAIVFCFSHLRYL